MDLNAMDQHICSEAWTSDEVVRNYRELCLTYRGRFSGSQNAAGAAAYIEKTLKKYGLSSAAQDTFNMTVWTRGTARLTLTQPHQLDFPCLALPYSPECNTEFQLVDAGMGHPEDLEKIPGGVSGKAVLIDDKNPRTGPVYHRLHKYLFAREAGAGAFIFAHTAPGMLPPTGSLAYRHSGPLHQTIPSIGVSSEVAAELREWSTRGDVRLNLSMTNTLEPGSDCNVIADLEGSKSSGNMIIVCGHYDGHDIAQGAVDNASGTVAVMEAARLLTPLKNSLNCTIRFVLFGSEEMGLVGPHHLAHSMSRTTEKIRFIFNLDCVGQPGNLMVMLQNCPELLSFFQDKAQSLPSDIQVNTHTVPFSDHFPFVMRGIPAAFLATPGDGSRGWGHTSADTLEKVSQETLMKVSMHTARLILATAQAKSWPVSPKTGDQIIPLLEKHHMKQLLDYEGHWPY